MNNPTMPSHITDTLAETYRALEEAARAASLNPATQSVVPPANVSADQVAALVAVGGATVTDPATGAIQLQYVDESAAQGGTNAPDAAAASKPHTFA